MADRIIALTGAVLLASCGVVTTPGTSRSANYTLDAVSQAGLERSVESLETYRTALVAEGFKVTSVRMASTRYRDPSGTRIDRALTLDGRDSALGSVRYGLAWSDGLRPDEIPEFHLAMSAYIDERSPIAEARFAALYLALQAAAYTESGAPL